MPLEYLNFHQMSRSRSSSSSSYKRIGLPLTSGPKSWISKLHASPSVEESSELDEVTAKVLDTETKLFDNFKTNLRADLNRSGEMKNASAEDSKDIMHLLKETDKRSQWLDHIN